MKPEVESITLKLGAKTLKLSPAEARELYHQLQNLFPREPAPVVINQPAYQDFPRWVVTYPPAFPQVPYSSDYPQVTCRSETSAVA